MLLAIDIGNTNISFGVFKGPKLIRSFNIATHNYNCKKLKSLLGKNIFKDAIICSVVPRTTLTLSRDLTKILGKKPYIIGKDIKVPVKNCYSRPKEVGADRLIGAYAGIQLYGAPLIIIDFGTAITFDLVSKDKAYLGGMILPGLQLSLDALAQKTALLPKLKLDLPKDFIGRDTKNSMLSGIVYGFASLTDNLIKKIRLKLGKNVKVIVTGGNTQLMAKYSSQIKIKNPDLILKGLRLVYQKEILCVK